MHQHTQMDLFSTEAKRPLSEAPRRGSLLSQKALQVEGEFSSCDPHPVYEGLFYFGKRPDGFQLWQTEDRWIKIGKTPPSEILVKRIAAVEYNRTKPDHEPPVYEEGSNVGQINQDEMQVAWKPIWGNAHPVYVNYRYLHMKRGKQRWVSLGAFEKKKEQETDWKASPEGRAKSAERAKRYIEKNPEKAAGYRSIFQRAYAEYKEGVITKEEYEKVCALGTLQAVLNTGLTVKDKWNLDHIIPSTHGGLTTVQNLQMVPNAWNNSKGNRNRNVMALQGPDYDIWYHTPYAFPKRREWALSLANKEITKLTFVPSPRGT